MARFNKNKSIKSKNIEDKIEENKNFQREEPEQIIQADEFGKNPSAVNSWIRSAAKYGSVITAIVLLSGIFTPFTFGVGGDTLVAGILIIIMGLVGGILIFIGLKQSVSYYRILVLVGLTLMVISVLVIISMSGRS